jgi:inward rectifier potassium channel
MTNDSPSKYPAQGIKKEVVQQDPNKDLGFGSRVAQQSRVRFLNRDGTFNVVRRGLSFFRSQNTYHWLLTISWVKFFLIVIAGYFVANILFAFGYILCGPGALRGVEGATLADRLSEAFFFSVQTLATIGYGRVSPNGLAANLLVTIEALAGLLSFALATGLLFARFSRPSAKILFSNEAIIAPYQDTTAFEFRIANERSNQLIEVEATVTLSRLETDRGERIRKFYNLSLERKRVVFLPLHWVIVHRIDETSPLYGITPEDFESSDAEFLILLTAIDETFAQTVHARSSYKHHEVVWGAKFRDMFLPSDDGMISIDMRRLHEIERNE